jgi:hypothetical protein
LRCPDPALAEQARDYVLGGLSEPDLSAFENHLAGCPACADETTRLEEGLARVERAAVETLPRDSGLWGVLAGTILRPGPALLYLLALLLIYPLLRVASPATDERAAPGASVLGRPLSVLGEPLFRGSSPTDGSSEPVPHLEIDAPTGTVREVLLELHMGLLPDDLREPGSSVLVEIAAEERILWSVRSPREALNERGVLGLLLDLERFSPDRVHTIVVRLDPAGEVVFRRSFLIRTMEGEP